MSVEDFDPAIDNLTSRFERAEVLIASILGGVAAGASARQLTQAQRQVAAILQNLLSECVGWVNQTIPAVYRDGAEQAARDMVLRLPRGVFEERLRGEFHRVSLESLAQGLLDDMAAATDNMSRDAKRTLREIGRRQLTKAMARTNPVARVPDFRAELGEHEIAFVDRAGKRWRPGVYARTALLTQTAVILNAGNLNTAMEFGSPGVRVSDGDGGDTDEPCVRAAGQTWSLSVAMSNPVEHPNCFPAGTVVSGPAAFASTSRRFEGDVVKIGTEGRRFLTVTPNHPILTSEGWVAAGSLVEGDYVISQIGSEGGEPDVVPNDYQIPALIEDVAGAVGSSCGMAPRVVPTAAKDFHGDGGGSEVCVIRADGLLRDGLNATLNEPVAQQDFSGRSMELLSLDGLRSLAFLLKRMLASTGCVVRGSGIGFSLFGTHSSRAHSRVLGWSAPMVAAVFNDAAYHAAGDTELFGEFRRGFSGEVARDDDFRQNVVLALSRLRAELLRRFVGSEKPSFLQFVFEGCVADTANLASGTKVLPSDVDSDCGLQISGVRGADGNAVAHEPPSDRFIRYAEPSSEALHGFAGRIAADKVVNVEVLPDFVGHVYNLQTEPQWYVANGIIVHNCRRSFAPLPPGWAGELDRQ